ncbi:hypothetical protein K458DRAFT_466715, partial [Lentithecium fluviatile CBS 122367]
SVFYRSNTFIATHAKFNGLEKPQLAGAANWHVRLGSRASMIKKLVIDMSPIRALDLIKDLYWCPFFVDHAIGYDFPAIAFFVDIGPLAKAFWRCDSDLEIEFDHQVTQHNYIYTRSIPGFKTDRNTTSNTALTAILRSLREDKLSMKRVLFNNQTHRRRRRREPGFRLPYKDLGEGKAGR